MEQSRRKLVGRVLLVLAWLYATAGSLSVLAMVVEQPPHWAMTPSGLRAVRVLLSVAVLGLDVVWLVLFGRDLARGEGGQYLLSSTPEGSARISLRAIHSSLLRRARDVADVIHVKVTVRRPEKDRIRVEVAYTTPEDRSAIVVSEALRRALRERFEELVHPEEDLDVEFDVKLDGFVPGGAGSRREEKRDQGSREPFTGPRYPVD